MIITDVENASVEAMDEVIAKNVGDTLHKHYPDYMWAVTVNGKGGIIQVLNLNLSGKWGFVLHIKDLDVDYKNVIRAGGEILERYRVNRGRMDVSQIQQLQHDNAGHIIVDDS